MCKKNLLSNVQGIRLINYVKSLYFSMYTLYCQLVLLHLIMLMIVNNKTFCMDDTSTCNYNI